MALLGVKTFRFFGMVVWSCILLHFCSGVRGDYDQNLVNAMQKTRLFERWWKTDPTGGGKCFLQSSLPCEAIVDATQLPQWLGSCAPHFVIIGAPKGGTTSLYEYLAAHPQVLRALAGVMDKEVRFFSEEYERGMAWYLRQFPPTLKSADGRTLTVSGEASPTYLFEKTAPMLMKTHMPRAKLIVLLRDPVERLISYWNMMVSVGLFAGMDFGSQMALQMRDWKKCYTFDDHVPMNTRIEEFHSCFFKPATRIEFDRFLLESIYVYQIANWLKYFDRSQILFLKNEAFYTNANLTKGMDQVTEFLGLCPIDWKPVVSVVHHQGKVRTNIPRETVAMLKDFFKPFNKMLSKLIAMDLDDWNDVPSKYAPKNQNFGF